ncbi:MAG: hypothetical protein ACYS9X_30535, partial [Planctomycetota bacterium]
MRHVRARAPVHGPLALVLAGVAAWGGRAFSEANGGARPSGRAPTSSAGEDAWAESYRRGRELYRAGKLEHAEKALLEAARRAKETGGGARSVKSLMTLAELQDRLDKGDEAERSRRKALSTAEEALGRNNMFVLTLT